MATLGTGKVAYGGPEGWLGQCGDAQHTALSYVATNAMEKVQWSTPIDLTPRYQGNSLLTHYGSPIMSSRHTLILPVKQNLDSDFVITAFEPKRRAVLWSVATDYIMPPHGWTPMCGPCLVGDGSTEQTAAWPAAGGRVSFRRADAKTAITSTAAFYGNGVYSANAATYNDKIRINTPLTAGPDGAVYFGFIVTGSNPANLTSGVAKVLPNGTGTWVPATTLSGDGSVNQPKMNCAPAITVDGNSVYIALTSGGFGHGCLVKLNSSTLALQARVVLKDPKSHNDGIVDDSGTASPLIAPDGDVYMGVLENPLGSNHFRGWMLHFSGDLQTEKIPGAFGWDDTPSIVPVSLVPSYNGPSPYLLCTKYNNYAGAGGDGVNKIALLDPFVAATETISGQQMMKEIATIAGPTPDTDFLATHPFAVREWCVNSSAVDVPKKSVILNCEDGIVYRWDFTTFTLSEAVRLTDGIGEAYTCTVIGPDGRIYATSNARVYAVGNRINQ